MNLLANAFKFVPTGGRVRCALSRSSSEIFVTVDDSGPGVKPELRQAIFERFRQGDGGSNRKAGGTGLGLAIAKEFVEMHQGTIGVLDSDLGGARFQITLPAPSDGPARFRPIEMDRMPALNRTQLDGLIEELRPNSFDRQAEPALSSKTERPRVLVVEDNADMNRFVAQCLARHYEVIVAFDGARAREGVAIPTRARSSPTS